MSRLDSVEKEQATRKPKYKLFKTGTLLVTCKGSGHVAWYGNRFHPTSSEEIEGHLNDFCRSCGVLKSVCSRSSEEP